MCAQIAVQRLWPRLELDILFKFKPVQFTMIIDCDHESIIHINDEDRSIFVDKHTTPVSNRSPAFGLKNFDKVYFPNVATFRMTV